MSRRIDEHDWSDSAIGRRADWPVELRTLVAVLLGSRQPMFLTWGAEHTLLYNDGYAEILGRKHPDALGRPFLDVWFEIRSALLPLVDEVKAGRSVHMDDITLIMERHGHPEEAHFAFSYTPVRDNLGKVAGIFCPCTETTRQVQAERRIIADRERLAQLFDQAPGFMAMLRGPEHAFELVNAAYLKLIGHRDVLNRPVRDALPEIGGQGFFELLDEVYSTGKAFKGTALKVGVQRTPGAPVEERFVDLVYQPVTDADGRVSGIFAEGSDVTERVRAEGSLRESEAQFRGVFNSRLTGLTIFDATTGHTLAINDTFLSMTGHSRADFDEGRWDWRDFTVPEFLHLDEEAISQARERGFWETYEKEYRRPDGSRFPVRIASAPLPGGPGRVVVSVQDISRARAAEAELRESEQRFRLAQQAAGIGVWDWNLIADAITWSPEMHELLDIDPGTPPGRLFEAWRLALHPEDRDRATFIASQAAQAGEPFSMDFRVVRRDGQVRWLRSQATAVLDADGKPVRLTGINVDVTAQHRVEEELRGETKKLAATVEERTRERNRVFELSSDLFAAAGFDGYLKVINPAWETLLGYTEAELLACPFIEFIHPDDHSAATEVVAAMIAGQAVKVFEDRLLHKDGHVV